MSNAILNFVRRTFGFSTPFSSEETQDLRSVPASPTPFNDDYFLRNPGPVVYLIQHGDRAEYKIGLTANINTRLNRIGLLMPEKVYLIHCIYTNDPKWLEGIWHKHFAGKRKFGSGKVKASEWFELTDSDVEEFRKHREWNNPDVNIRSQLPLFLNETVEEPKPRNVAKPSLHQAVNSHTRSPTSVPSSIPDLPSRFVVEAISRVNRHFDNAIAVRPDRISKLTKARNWELSQVDIAMRYWCEQRGYTQIEALKKWEENACKSADAKIR